MADDTTTEDDTAAAAATDKPKSKPKPWQRLRKSDREGTAAADNDTATTSRSTAGSTAGGKAGGHGVNATRLRALLAQTLWAICVVAALILAVAVLLIAVDANTKNDLVLWVIHRADNVDLGFFDLNNPIKDWDLKTRNPAQDVKTALFNYGIAAVVWLALGKFLDKVVRA